MEWGGAGDGHLTYRIIEWSNFWLRIVCGSRSGYGETGWNGWKGWIICKIFLEDNGMM